MKKRAKPPSSHTKSCLLGLKLTKQTSWTIDDCGNLAPWLGQWPPTPGGGGDLAPSLLGCVVTKWRAMGSFWASREWEGVHLYGYVFTGIITGMGRIFSFVPFSCELYYLKTKGLAQAYPPASCLM